MTMIVVEAILKLSAALHPDSSVLHHTKVFDRPGETATTSEPRKTNEHLLALRIS